ncbi:MAG: hypothetical protein ABI579_00220 [Candidatus Sumerlaeota bacterium]
MDLRVCDSCGRWIESNETLFVMNVTIQAEAGVIDLDANAPGDVRDEFEKLIHAMERMTTDQISEATDEVHENYRFALCDDCRKDVHKRLKSRINITGNY